MCIEGSCAVDELTEWRGRLRSLVEAAESGESGSLERLRSFVASQPAAEVVLERMVPTAREAWLKARASGSVVRLEASERAIGLLREQLEAGGRTPLERLVVEQICVDWLALDVAECAYAGVVGRRHASGDERYWARRVDGAHRRMMRSIRTLAQVRKLGLPAVIDLGGG